MPEKGDEQQKHNEEAERVAKLFPDEYAALIARLRSIAADRRVRKADREAARERAEMLEKVLEKRGKPRNK